MKIARVQKTDEVENLYVKVCEKSYQVIGSQFDGKTVATGEAVGV